MNIHNISDTDQQPENIQPSSELREIVIGWERLRILYNVILLLIGLVTILPIISRSPIILDGLLTSIIKYGIGANIFFCAGPTAEVYVRFIFKTQNNKMVRIVLFTLGTLLSLFPNLAIIANSE
jgi:hypothetical protein